MAAVHPIPSSPEPRRLSGPKPALARLAAAAAEGLPLEELDRRSRSPPPSRRASWPPSRRGSAASSAGGDAAGVRAALDGAPALCLLAASLAVAVGGSDAAVLLRMPDTGPPRAGLDAAIIVVMALWTAELATRWACVPAYRRSLHLLTDAAAAASLLADLSWLAPSAGMMRACRAARLVRAARLTSVVGAAHAAVLARRAKHAQHAARAADAPAPSAIAAAVAETVLHKLAVVLVVMLVCATPLLTQVESDGAAGAWRDAFAAARSGGAAQSSLDGLAAACAASFSGARTRPTALAVGDAAWSWQPPDTPPPVRAADRLVLTGDGVRFELDASAKNAYIAKANVFMATATVAALFAVSVALLFVTHATVVAPLERIFAIIQASASAALGALCLDGGGGGSAAARAVADEGGPAMGAVEAAVAKLSRLVAHLSTGTGERGGSALESYLADDNMDGATRAWLHSQLGGGSTFSGASSTHSARRKGSQLPPAYRRASTPSPLELERMAAFALEASPGGVAAALSLPISIGYALPSGEPQVSLALLDSWEFDSLELSTGQLLASVVQMFDAVGAFGARLVSPPRLWAFAGALAGRYEAGNPYHNFAHAVDVAHGVFRFLRLTERRLRLPAADKFALLVAALAHDVEHPGVNNAFLVATRHPLALRYNDASVLESRHCAALFGLCAAQPEADVFAGLDDAGWRAARRVVLGAVLATDMSHHFKLISQAELYLELHGDTPQDAPLDIDAAAPQATPPASSGAASSSASSASAASASAAPFATAEERSLLFALLLHAADIGNPTRPPHVAAKWAERVQAEFFAQGDAEAAASLPVSPGMARGAPKAAGQINFIEFVVAPLYALLARALPELTPCLRQLALNRAAFAPAFEAEAAEAAARGAKSEAEAADECAKMRNRHRAFEAKYEALTGPLGAGDAVPPAPPSPGDAGGAAGTRLGAGGGSSTSPVRRRVATGGATSSAAWLKAGSQAVRSLLAEAPARSGPRRGSFTRAPSGDALPDPEMGIQRPAGRRGSFPPPRPPHF